MCLGVYSYYLNAVATINLSILFPMFIGAIIGFVLGSIFVLYPSINFEFEGILSLVIFAFSFSIGLKLERLENS